MTDPEQMIDHDPECVGGKIARYYTPRRVEMVCRGCHARTSVPRDPEAWTTEKAS